MEKQNLLELTPAGLYCRAGDFYIDPWRPVGKAVITHGHADHARPGHKHYLSSESGAGILKHRLGYDISIQASTFGETVQLNGLELSLHPAGHILGSAQVRMEYRGEVWVVSGDYNLNTNLTCESFEILPCHTFVTESTFGLPIFRWDPEKVVFDDINAWWKRNNSNKKTSILFAYSLGKAQRIIAGLNPQTGPILTHGAVENVTVRYRESLISLPDTQHVGTVEDKSTFEGAIVIAPPSSDTPGWMKKFPNHVRGFASGWMQIRGNRRRRSLDRGFVLSDHSDWEGILTAISSTGAENIWATHGYTSELVRWLQEKGLNAKAVETRLPDMDEDEDGAEDI